MAHSDAVHGNSTHANTARDAAADLVHKRLILVNVAFFGLPKAGHRQWVLIDAGLPRTASGIVRSAEARFGKNAAPAAIILTHGHFDHAGTVKKLVSRWDVPVYAHTLELPYLNGQTSYLPPDPSVGGGLFSRLSSFYPRGPIDVGPQLQSLPEDGSVPGMPGWRWLHTPGHTPGHISLWRESDRLLIAGDAFVTTEQESAFAVALQKPEIHGPPKYYTPDWKAAESSVRALAALKPETVVTGHGPAMRGTVMQEALHCLADDFQKQALPMQGRYVTKLAQAS